MKNLYFSLTFYSLINFSTYSLVKVSYASNMLGNKLFAYCFGRIISEELGMQLECPPIKGFPETYKFQTSNVGLFSKLPNQILSDNGCPYVNLNTVLSDKSARNINLFGYFQRYEYYKKYKRLIKNIWLMPEKNIESHLDCNDVVLHIRLNVHWVYYLPISYYEEALSLVNYNRVYICTDNPEHEFLNNFKKYNPIIVKHYNPYSEEATLSDFLFIMSFQKIIVSQSTFSWWAAFLSDAKTIFMPLPKHGYMCPEESPNINLKVDDDERYYYIKCDNSITNYWSWSDPIA